MEPGQWVSEASVVAIKESLSTEENTGKESDNDQAEIKSEARGREPVATTWCLELRERERQGDPIVARKRAVHSCFSGAAQIDLVAAETSAATTAVKSSSCAR